MTLPRIALLISGRGSNMEAILRAAKEGVLRGRCVVCGVIANHPEAAGLAQARRLGVATRIVPSKGLDTCTYGRRLLAALSDWGPDYVVLAGFMRIVSSDLVAAYPGRIVNIHPANTADYQGPDGYGWAAKRRLPETLITVHLVDEGVDTGPVLRQARVSLTGADTKGEIARRGLVVEHALYSACLAELFDGRYDDAVASVAARWGKG